MKFKNLIKIFCVGAGVVFAVACSDDGDEPDSSGTTEVTSQLSAPRNVTYSSTQTSINFSWGSVSGATGYEAVLSESASGAEVGDAETSSTSYTFSGLEGGTSYVFAVRALYSPNPEFNSEFTEISAETLEYTKLAAPTNLAASSVTETSATITWNAVSGAANYRVKLATTAEGTELDNAVQSANVYYATGLSANVSYTVSVKALSGDGSTESEWDSDEATLEFTATVQHLTAPELTVAHYSHAMAIMEWSYTNDMLAEQSLGSADTFNFRLCSSDGTVLREVSGYNAFNFDRYTSYRLAWGGLEASTTYLLEAQRVADATSIYEDSNWASVEVATDAAPDKSSYLLWWDFDNVPFSACAMYAAYGFTRTAPSDNNWASPNNITYGVPSSSNQNTIYTQAMNGFDQSYYDTYLPGIQASEVLAPADNVAYQENTTHNCTVEVGHFKFGAGSRNAWVTLPALSDLSSNSTIYLELDTCPYTEPKSGNAGDWYTPNNSDITEYFYVWAPKAKIESVEEGETSESAVINPNQTDETNGNESYNDEGLVKLKNVLVTDGSYKTSDADPYRYTSHKIKISGVGPSTRIVIYTGLVYDGSNHRMWMDNVKISKAD